MHATPSFLLEVKLNFVKLVLSAFCQISISQGL